MTFRADDDQLIAETSALRVVFDGRTGAVRTVHNIVSGQTLVDARAATPWRMRGQGGGGPFFSNGPRSYRTVAPTPESFSYEVAEDGERALLRWTTSDPNVGVEVSARIQGDELELWPRVAVGEGVVPPEGFEYPVLVPQPLSEDESSEFLVYPAQAGWNLRAPLRQQPLAVLYPDGFSGAPLQFMGYYQRGVGGFYLACHDPHSTCKRLRFSSENFGFDHLAWDIRAGASLDLGYPVVLAPLVVGDWFEVAARYRAWALVNAPWAAGGVPVREQPGRQGGEWMHEGVGLSIWCTPSSTDWSRFYRQYAELTETPLHIVPAWDWPQTLPPTLGREGVFPARFHPANVEAWQGHYVTPYLNDLFVSYRAPDFFEHWEQNLLFPYAGFSWLPFSEPSVGWVDGNTESPDPVTTSNVDFFVCPTTDALKDLHAWRDEILAREYGMHGVFYDISSGNPENWSRCLRAEHRHTPGRGRSIVRAYAELNRISKEAVAASTGQYFVQGVEVINETLIDSVDYYVSRACAGPLGLLETWMLGPEDQPGGDRELIPLFSAVYHDIGPVHHDGWITLDESEGTLFFWIAARIYLQWGGLLSLQYSTVPPESLDGHQAPAATVLWHGGVHQWNHLPSPDPGKVAFVRELASTRTGVGRPYLAYGELLRGVPHECAQILVDWRQRPYGHGAEGLLNEGTWTVPQVLHSAWRAQDARLGLFFVNLHGNEPASIRVRTDTRQLWQLELNGATVTATTDDRREQLEPIGEESVLSLTLSVPPQKVVLVEIEPRGA